MRKALLILAILLVLVVFSAILGGPALVRKYIFHGDPQLAAAYKDWKTKKIQLPGEILEVKPFRPETLAAARALGAAWALYKDKANTLPADPFAKGKSPYRTSGDRIYSLGPRRRRPGWRPALRPHQRHNQRRRSDAELLSSQKQCPCCGSVVEINEKIVLHLLLS